MTDYKLIDDADSFIMRMVNLKSAIRKRLVLDPLPQGCIPSYDAEITDTSIVFDKNEVVQIEAIPSNNALTIYVPLHPYTFIETVNKDEKVDATFLVNKVIKTITTFEDNVMSLLLKKAVNINNNYVYVKKDDCLFNTFQEAKHKMNAKLAEVYQQEHPNDNPLDHGVLLTGLYINSRLNAEMLSEIKNNRVGTANIQMTDPNYYYIEGIDVMTTNNIEYNEFIGLPEPEYLGVIPILTDLHVAHLTKNKIVVETNIGYGLIVSKYVIGCKIE